jgi:P-type E1-E2 ATPase
MADGELVGLAALSERLRPFVRSVVRELGAMGIPAEVMTGDREAVGVGQGFRVATGLTPEQKATAVGELEAKGDRVLFVGDGLNDAEAMVRATASLALATGQETARDVALGELDPTALANLPQLLAAAQDARRRARRIVGFALTYNAVGIAAAVVGWLHPVLAAVIMFSSSATVLAMALRGLGNDERSFDRGLQPAAA